MDHFNYASYEDNDEYGADEHSFSNNASAGNGNSGNSSRNSKEKGKSLTTYHVEFSKSNRSKCRGCKQLIEKDVVRVGCTIVHADEDWYHLKCFKTPKNGLNPDEITGIHKLSEDDQVELINILSIPYQRASRKKEKSESSSSAAANHSSPATAKTPAKPASSSHSGNNSSFNSSSGQVLSSSSSSTKRKTPAEIADMYEKKAAKQSQNKGSDDIKYESQEKSEEPLREGKLDFEPMKEDEKRKIVSKSEINKNILSDIKDSSTKLERLSNPKSEKDDFIDAIVLDDDDDDEKEKQNDSSSKFFVRKKRVERDDYDEDDDKNYESLAKKKKIENTTSTKSTISSTSSQTKQRSSVQVDGDGTMISVSDPGKTVNIAKYAKMSISELKDILRANGQLLSGTKQELIDRCVDGEKNGRLPKCPTCIKGTLHFDSKKNCIVCGGYYDTDINMRISCKFTAGTIQRLPWAHTADEASSINEKLSSTSSSSKNQAQHKLRSEDVAKLIELKKVSAKEAASFLLKKAREFKLTLPSDDVQARLAIGGILMASTDASNGFDPQSTMNEIAEKYPSNEEKLDSMPQAKRPENSVLAHMFDELAKKEKNAGGEFAMFKAKSAKQAAIAIRDLDFVITSGKALSQGKNKVPGIGKGSAALIDEFLQTGTFSRLNEI